MAATTPSEVARADKNYVIVCNLLIMHTEKKRKSDVAPFGKHQQKIAFERKFFKVE